MNRCLLALLLVGCTATPADDDDSATPAPSGPPCASWDPATVLGTVEDPTITEISGLVASRRNPGVLWVHEDSGAAAVITALDRSGATLGTLRLDAPALDNEDLALGPCPDDDWCLVLADIGDNAEARPTVALRRVIEPDLGVSPDASFELEVEPETVSVSYPDGPENAEGVVVTPEGDVVIVTKRNDGDAKLLRVPAAFDVDVAEHVSTITIDPVGGLPNTVTGSDLSQDGDWLLLRTYGGVYQVDLSDVGLAGAADGSVRVLPAAAEPQGEAVAWDADGRSVLQVSEATNPPLYWMRCASTP